MTNHRKQLPIGYWLKRADQLLTARIDDVQRAHALTRLDWQMLTLIHETGTASSDSIAEALQPFADRATVNQGLLALEHRGLIQSEGDGLKLTEAGRELYEKASISQKTIRERAFAGMSEAEYKTTVAILQRLVANLERDDDHDSDPRHET